jgi:hypothetical protein
MGRFYFHLQHGGELLIDPEGTELPDCDVARQEALRSARELLANEQDWLEGETTSAQQQQAP